MLSFSDDWEQQIDWFFFYLAKPIRSFIHVYLIDIIMNFKGYIDKVSWREENMYFFHETQSTQKQLIQNYWQNCLSLTCIISVFRNILKWQGIRCTLNNAWFCYDGQL